MNFFGLTRFPFVKVPEATGLLSCTVFLFLLSFSLPGCKDHPGTNNDFRNQVVDLSIIDTLSYRFVNLEYTPQSKIGEISELLFDDDRIFIFDSRDPFSLFIFDSSGKFINSVTRTNMGPVADGGSWLTFDLDRQRKEILIYDIGAQRILRYTYAGVFVRENKLVSYRGIQFAYLGNDNYAFWMESESDHQVVITDSSGFIISSHHPFPEKYNALMSFIPGYFSKGDDNSAYYIPIWEDKIYKVSQAGVTQVADLQFSANIVSTDDEINLLRMNRPLEKYSCFFSLHVTASGQYYTSIQYLGQNADGQPGLPLYIFGKLGTDKTTGGHLPAEVGKIIPYGEGAGHPSGRFGEYFVRIVHSEKSASPDNSWNPSLLFYKVKI
jgi:hypothetical protein